MNIWSAGQLASPSGTGAGVALRCNAHGAFELRLVIGPQEACFPLGAPQILALLDGLLLATGHAPRIPAPGTAAAVRADRSHKGR
jgi:hypothetical protein